MVKSELLNCIATKVIKVFITAGINEKIIFKAASSTHKKITPKSELPPPLYWNKSELDEALNQPNPPQDPITNWSEQNVI